MPESRQPWVTPHCADWRARRAWILDQQVALASVPAPTGNESARGALVQRLFATGTQTDATVDTTGNVETVVRPLAPLARDASPLVCLAHLDTVYAAPAESPAVPITRDGLHVTGAGIGDNGRGLAALIALARLLRTPDIRQRLVRPVHLVATVGEEGDGNLRGARAWFDAAESRGTRPHAALAIDGPGDESIVHQAVGSLRLRCAFHGAGGHSWLDATRPNPAMAVGGCIMGISRLAASLRDHATVTVTRIHGGESLTSMPAQAWIDVDVRSASPRHLAQVHDALQRLVRDAADSESRRDPVHALTTHLTTLGERPAGALGADSPLLRAALRATHAVGRTPRSASASTDANIPLSRGIPAVAIGAGGRGGGAHTSAEWYDDTDAPVGFERVMRLVLALAAD